MRRIVCTCAALGLCLGAAAPARAQGLVQYRAFWVDTFNTVLNTHADVMAVVNNAVAARANALVVQVRRRGDAWYLNALEPPPDFTPIAAGFDPLQDLIDEAHARGIEVHAFVIIGAVWNKNPNFAPSATLGPPTNPNHVFNLHGGYDPVIRQIVPGPNNWLTRTLLPDGAGGIGFQGHRFGSDFWLDLGHPDAAAYTVDVLMHLARNYDIDGLHLDRIRYPEFSVAGQTPSTGTNIGYNQTSIERFQRHYGIAAGSPPAQNDPLWSQWRRDQVTNFVRRLYLNAIEAKPHIKMSAALIAFGGGPTTEAAWNSAEAYWRVYQDWRAWTEEGILDLAMPMDYKREHVAAQVTQFDQWAEWLKTHQYNRGGLIGQGAFLNSIEGTLRQVRRGLAPSAAGQSALGVTFFSMATSNALVNANPLSLPPGMNTPVRPFAEFASGLTTGRSVNGLTLYEDPVANPMAVFAEIATIPVLPWKAAPTTGHLMGFARGADDAALDTAPVMIQNLETAAARTVWTDGGGFYGGVDLDPGRYRMETVIPGARLFSCIVRVSAGTVTTADVDPETVPPLTEALLDPPEPDGANGWYTRDVRVTLQASDACAGVERTEYSLDDGATWTAYADSLAIAAEGETSIAFRSVDAAGNAEDARSLTLRIDKTNPTLSLTVTPSLIWPPDGRSVETTLNAVGRDDVSGLAAATYVVTDEYGAPLTIPSRTLSGGTATWQEALGLEATRDGEDRDGRLYRVIAMVSDQAGRSAIASADIIVAHDRRPGSR